MRKFGVLLLAAMFLFLTVAPAWAHGPGFHRAPFWPLFAPLFLPVAVAATVATGVATVATGVATAVTAPFTYPYVSAGPPPTYAPAAVYAPPPAGMYAPAPAAVYAPPAYARSGYVAPPPPPPSYWYYCPSAGGYYPNVRVCPGGWLTVVPR